MKKLTKKDKENLAKEVAKKDLLKILKDSKTVHTILRSVSSSGMSRVISFMVVDEKGEIHNINYLISTLLDYKQKNANGFYGLAVSGCGMDMGFKVVYDLSRVLYNDTVKERAGYILSQRWI